MGRVGPGPAEFRVILGRVGLGNFTCGSGGVGSKKLDTRPTPSRALTLNHVVVSGPDLYRQYSCRQRDESHLTIERFRWPGCGLGTHCRRLSKRFQRTRPIYIYTHLYLSGDLT